MDNKRAQGTKHFFPRFAVQTTMMQIVADGDRDAVVFVNGGPASVYAGKTGTPIANWMELPSGQGFTDNYSKDNWWVYAPSSSGTVSGFIVQGG